MPLPIYVYEAVTMITSKNKISILLLGIAHISFIFVFAFLYQYFIAPNQLLVLIVLFGLVTIIDVLHNYCFDKKSK